MPYKFKLLLAAVSFFVTSTMFLGESMGQCKTEKAVSGMALKRHTFRTLVVGAPHECDIKCEKEIACQSYNFARREKICELNNRTKEARPEDFVPDANRFYIRRLTNRVPLGSIPELPAESCQEIKASEGFVDNRNYWLNSTQPGEAVLTQCIMETKGKYALRFSQNESGGDYVIKHGTPSVNLTAMTLCLWLKTDDQQHRGTPISYAVPGQLSELVLFDYKAFYFELMGQKRKTMMSANDGKWHHICVWWSTTGRWKMFKDGKRFRSGQNFQTGGMIRGGGALVLGQEQDELGGGFQNQQSFIGEITGLNIWDHVINDTEVARMNRSCFTGEGNVVKWSEFRQFNISRGVELINQPTCPT